MSITIFNVKENKNILSVNPELGNDLQLRRIRDVFEDDVSHKLRYSL